MSRSTHEFVGAVSPGRGAHVSCSCLRRRTLDRSRFSAQQVRSPAAALLSQVALSSMEGCSLVSRLPSLVAPRPSHALARQGQRHAFRIKHVCMYAYGSCPMWGHDGAAVAYSRRRACTIHRGVAHSTRYERRGIVCDAKALRGRGRRASRVRAKSHSHSPATCAMRSIEFGCGHRNSSAPSATVATCRRAWWLCLRVRTRGSL